MTKARHDKWSGLWRWVGIQTHSHKCGKMQANESQHSQEVDSKFGNWSFVGISNFWDKVLDIKTCSNWAFFIPLKIYWSVGIKNGLAISTWWFKNTSYGQKIIIKKSNYQFVSQTLKLIKVKVNRHFIERWNMASTISFQRL